MNEFANTKNIMWVVLSGALMLLVLVLLIIGGGDAIISSVYSVMLWCGLFGGALARYLGKNGWAGFGFGSAIGMVLHVLAPLISNTLLA